MSDLQAIADELRVHFDAGTWYEALIPHFATTIDVVHQPHRAPEDGPVSAEALATSMRDNHVSIGFCDARQSAESITVDDDAITAVQLLTATLSNGTPVRVRLTQVFGFAGTQVVRLEHHTNQADVEAAMKAVAEANA